MKSEPTIGDLEREIFSPDIVPVDAGTIAAYAHHISHFAVPSFTTDAATVHARAIGTHEELAAALRSPELFADLAGAAEVMAVRYAKNQREHAAAEVERYKRIVAEQLAGTSGHKLSRVSKRYIEALDARDSELAAEAERTEQARAEAERLAAEERERKRAEAERRRAELALAEEEARSADAISKAAHESHRKMRAQWFAAELARSGLTTLKVRGGFLSRGNYSVPNLIALAPQLTSEELARYEAALAAALEAQEASEA